VAHATVLLESVKLADAPVQMVATAEAEDDIDEVVKGLVGDSRDISALGRKRPTFNTDDLT
jgi:2-C-methyl-D-erythritol 2,4-cyclodiphosphate synthase